MITFEDCRRELLDRGGESALAAYQAWLDRPGYQPVHELVHGFKHDYLLRITHNELLDARARSEHALGDVRTEEQMAEVEDWTTPFAFQHLFHLNHPRKPLPSGMGRKGVASEERWMPDKP